MQNGLSRFPFLIQVAGKARWICRLSGDHGGLIKLIKNFTKKKAAKTEKAKRIKLLFIKGPISGFAENEIFFLP
jgi:hypothetical protein